MADLRTVLKSKRFPVKKTIYVSILHLRLSEGGNLNKLSLKKRKKLFCLIFVFTYQRGLLGELAIFSA